ncbi:hypothetical protein LIA77_01531 [Sarocladium implicatum]|nr:hypothetical protein LIA77_01531 [Sarocladium implicatum]
MPHFSRGGCSTWLKVGVMLCRAQQRGGPGFANTSSDRLRSVKVLKHCRMRRPLERWLEAWSTVA